MEVTPIACQAQSDYWKICLISSVYFESHWTSQQSFDEIEGYGRREQVGERIL